MVGGPVTMGPAGLPKPDTKNSRSHNTNTPGPWYQHRERFGALAWWQTPTSELDQAGALASLTYAWKNQPRLPMMQTIGSQAELNIFLPKLTALLANQTVLLVLDNIETRLTRAATWCDPMFGQLISAVVSMGPKAG